MFILIKANKTHQLEICRNNTIQTLKRKIQDCCGYPVNYQRLIFDGKQLQNKYTLNHYNINNLSVIYCLLSPPKCYAVLPQSIKLNINLSSIIPFIDLKQKTHTIHCKHYHYSIVNIWSKLQLNEIDTNLTNNLTISIKHEFDEKDENIIRFNDISKVFDKRIVEIDHMLHHKYPNSSTICKDELAIHFGLDDVAQIINEIEINSPYLNRMTDHFHNVYHYSNPEWAHCECHNTKLNEFEMQIIFKIAAYMNTLQNSQQNVLHHALKCLHAFSLHGIPQEIEPEKANESIIPSIIRILSVIDGSNYMDEKFINVLTRIFRNISTYGNNRNIYRKTILKHLKTWTNPCTDKVTLRCICNYYDFVVCGRFRLSYDASNMFAILFTLIFYEDDQRILATVMKALQKIFEENAWMSQQKMMQDDVVKIEGQYGKKYEQTRIIFQGFIFALIKDMNIEYIPNDIACIMFNYFNCYENVKVNLIGRLMEMLCKTNGYSTDIISHALQVSMVVVPSMKCWPTDKCLDGYIENDGLIEGLLRFMDKKIHQMVKSEENKHEVEQDIVSSISVLESLLEDEDSKHVCLQQIKEVKCIDMILKMKKTDKERIGVEISIGIDNLVDVLQLN